MRIWFVLVLLLAVVPPLAGAAVINGVWICGVQYACGATDGVCPTTYAASGDTCITCDPNCGSCTCNNNGACDAGESSALCPADCPPARAAAITFAPTSPTATAGIPFTVTLTGSTDPSLFATLQLNPLPSGVVLQAGSLTSMLISNSGSNSITVMAATPGTYTFTGTVSDPQGSLAPVVSASYTVTVVDTPPVITPVTFANTSVWPALGANGENVDYTFLVSDDAAGASMTFNFGDGTLPSPPQVCAISPCPYTISHFYLAETTYTASITVTDSAGQTRSYSYPVRTAVGLPIVYGTQTGNQTTQPNNNPDQCDANSCRQQVAGRWTCFSAFACSPNDATICAGVTSPPTFIPRDYDGNQVHCEAAASTSCTQYTWANVARQGWPGAQQMCIGDDVGQEFLNTNTATWRTACQAAGMCYAAAGSNPSTQNRCYMPVAENDVATCTDGIDNNCNGVFDETELGCAAESVIGRIQFLDDSGSLGPAPLAIGEVVTQIGSRPGSEIKCSDWRTDLYANPETQSVLPQDMLSTLCPTSTGTQSYADTVAFSVAGPPLGRQYVAVSSFGYEAQIIEINAIPGQRVVIPDPIVLTPTVCNADCTNRQGYCDRACIGVGACQPDAVGITTLNACHPEGAAYGLKAGQEVILGYDEAAGTANVGLCCSIPAATRTAPKSAVTSDPAFGKIDTLVRYTSTVIINGRPYKLVINTW